MTDLNQQMRAEFEAWMREDADVTDEYLSKCHDGSYFWTGTNDRWKAWQAARRQHGSAAQAVGKVINGVFWPEGYCTDPNGVIIAPAGRKQDFDFGYDIGYAEGLIAIKDSVKAIEERVRAAPPVANTAGVNLPPEERDEAMHRDFLPLPNGWEIQTKGKGSTFRIAHAPSGERWMVLDEKLHKPLEQIARDCRAALKGESK